MKLEQFYVSQLKKTIMKKKNFFWSLMAVVMAVTLSVGLASCGDDKKDDKPEPTPDPVVLSLADMVSGTYSGRLTLGDEVKADAYIIDITKLTSTTVAVKAKFFGDDPMNFNLSQVNGLVIFSNATLSNFDMSYTNGSIVINYLSNGGNMLTYRGSK